MKRITVAPNFELDDEMYGKACAALARIAPEEVERFTWERFVARESWFFVPDTENRQKLDDPWFKADLVIKHGDPYHQTIKLVKWRLPDLRKDGAWMPHNHPWPFESDILSGWYEEDRYELPNKSNRNRILVNPLLPWEVENPLVNKVVHEMGSRNDVPLDVFHEVTNVEPGTLTMMNCDYGRDKGWGHLVDDGKGNLVYEPILMSQQDKRFKPMALALNPHLRKK